MEQMHAIQHQGMYGPPGLHAGGVMAEMCVCGHDVEDHHVCHFPGGGRMVEECEAFGHKDGWTEVIALVNEQAEDEALWAVYLDGSQSISEAYLQQELRRLHAAVERAAQLERENTHNDERAV